MATIWKDQYPLEVISHPQPDGGKLLEVMAPEGFRWSGDTWSIHGADMKDLRERVQYTDLEETDEDDLG